MKKFLLSLIALLGVVSANAQTTADVSGYDNAIYAVGGHYGKGVEFQLPIKIKNAIKAQACTFYVSLEEGLSFVPNSKDETAIAATIPSGDDDHTVMSNIDGGKVVLFSPSNAELPEDMVLLHLTAAEAGEYTVTVNYLNISNADDHTEITLNESFVSTVVIDDFVTLDENSTISPLATTSNVDVKVKRTIKAGQWSTLCLPFAMTKAKADAAFGSDASYAQFNDWTVVITDEGVPTSIDLQFTKKTLSNMSSLAAGVPVLVKTTKDISEFDVPSVKIQEATKPVEKTLVYGGEETSFTGTFVGVYSKQLIPENGLFINDNKFYYSVGKTTTKGFRGYFMLDAVLGHSMFEEVKFNILVDDETTSIDGIQQINTRGAVYTIDGKFVGRDVDQKKLQKGIYIIDGKKVAIK